MHSTRRLLDQHSRAALAALVAVGYAATTRAAAASCSSDADSPTTTTDPLDAFVEAAPVEDAALDQRGPTTPPTHYDAGPAPIVCTTHPCAVALVGSTTPSTFAVQTEGYCALLDDGTVACWGAGGDGELGRGEEAGGPVDSAKAARVDGLSNVVKLHRTCAVDRSGAVWCWGTGPFVLDDAGTVAFHPTPVRLPLPHAKNIAVGEAVGCAELDDGMTCWGNDGDGLFSGSLTFGARPATHLQVPAGAPIREIAVSRAAFVYREDGTVVSWGTNPPLGRVSSLDPDPNPRPIALGAIASLDVAADCACATADGTGYCWGSIDTDRSLGEAPPATLHALPTPVVAPEPLVQIATTQRSRFTTGMGPDTVQEQRWCAVGASGGVHCWGYNSTGQAGDGTKNYAFQSVVVAGLPGPAVEVKTMPLSTCALLATGQIYCWGNNLYGQLGNGTIKGVSLTPQRVVLP